MLRSLSVCLICSGLLASEALAQQWAEKMFNKMEHDFGTVARGSDTVYKFEITNIYKQKMKITGVRSSCGCTTPTIENAEFASFEKAYIVAKFNTRTFVGRHGATLTVSFAPPYRAEVQVRVHGNIRSDVVFSPGSINFGDVDEGQAAEKLVKVTYAGRNNWSIVDVTNDNDFFEVELKETIRQFGKVSYNLLVRLRETAPAGYIKDELTVITNDQRAESKRIPLYVEANVIPEISVTPKFYSFGEMLTQETKKVRLVVRGKKPFRITNVKSDDNCFTFDYSDQEKQIHLVEVTYTPVGYSGEIKVPVQISTDQSQRGSTVMMSASVVDAGAEPSAEGDIQADTSSQTGEDDAAAKVVADSAASKQ